MTDDGVARLPTADAYERHRLLRRAHEEALITYDEAASSDETYRVHTADGQALELAAGQVAGFYAGLLAGFAAARSAAELDAALSEVGVAVESSGQCRHCQAPLASESVVRCPVCARSQVQPL
ncbi:hypothetical protein RIF23_02385 [Lipingzhangella sp. LS1_29]|uniref:Zinc ribbon domain-containing protein n=1 Tax=Lipingzhangella rawalii TaxID=2055835 RepID=A0ABU2H1F2_9ACTN|nr:hypothetical protein [Lipingzhangella rawalii]MDS1269140.1 hypothetical protein [Lipingzhangella rawalii]